MSLKLDIPSFSKNSAILGEFAFCVPDLETHVTLAPNRNPQLQWSGVPEGTESLVVLCVDPDVPSVGDDVNQEGKTVSTDLPRVDFYHWVLINIDPERTEIPAGADSDGVTARGKALGPTELGVRGLNNYTDWFSGDKDMGGDYGGYDGPCPPWNDELLHRYFFRIYALNTELDLSGRFGGPEVLHAMEGHILARDEWMGTYTLNPEV